MKSELATLWPASHLVEGAEHVSSVEAELHLAMTKSSIKLTEGLLSHQRTQPEHSLQHRGACSTKDRFFQDDTAVLAIHSKAVRRLSPFTQKYQNPTVIFSLLPHS